MSFTEKLSFKRELYEAMNEDIHRGGWRTKVESLINRELARQEHKARFLYDDEDTLPPALEAAKETFLSTIKE